MATKTREKPSLLANTLLANTLLANTKMPKYEQLAAHLRQEIEVGRLKPSDRLPTFNEMRAKHNISQATLDRTYQMLEQNGLIVRQQGRGTFVAQQNAAPPAEPAARNGWLQDSIAVLTPHGQELPPPGSDRLHGSMRYLTRGVAQAIESAGLHTLMLHPDQLARRQVEQLTQSHPFGLIVTDIKNHTPQIIEMVQQINAGGVPVVCYGGAAELADYDRVVSDHEAGSYQVARWLIEQGRQRIVTVWGTPANGYWFPQRRAGYERALKESGLEPLPGLIIPGTQRSAPTQEVFNERVRQVAAYLVEHLTSPTPPDAMMFDTDSNAFYVAAAMRLFHQQPNVDVALAGYDNYWLDSRESRFESAGPLVSVDKLNSESGALLVELLQERALGKLPPQPQLRVLPPRMVVADEAVRPQDPNLKSHTN